MVPGAISRCGTRTGGSRARSDYHGRYALRKTQVEAAIRAALAETGATSLKQMGLVMKAAQAKLAGKRVDGKALSDKVRARLS